MCSNEQVGTPGDFGLSDRHYRIRGHELAEAMPDRCPAGHILEKNTILVSNHPCTSCNGSSHRCWRCRECDACWIWPACTDRPDWPEWSGIQFPWWAVIGTCPPLPRQLIRRNDYAQKRYPAEPCWERTDLTAQAGDLEVVDHDDIDRGAIIQEMDDARETLRRLLA